MLKSVCASVALLVDIPAFAAPKAGPSAEAASPAVLLTVDSPLHELIGDRRTRAVIVKHMPCLAERMESEPEVAQIFGGVSLTDMLADPHVKGLTPEVLAKLNAEFVQAQKAASTP